MFVNNIELPDLNVGDADVMEKFESEMSLVTQKMSSIDIKKSTQSQAIRIQCRAIFEFFNNIFGDGTDKELFGDKTDLMICMNAFEEITNNVIAAKNALADSLKSKAKQYTPNRQQRRQQRKNKTNE